MRRTAPLAEIEHRVLERAKEQLLDLDGDDAEHRLRLLIEDEIAQWSLDHKHGQRPFDLSGARHGRRAGLPQPRPVRTR